MKRLSLVLAIVTIVAGCSAAPPALRLYIFDNGEITGLDPKLFGFAREELKEVDFVNVSYLIVTRAVP